MRSSFYGPGTGDIFLDNVGCTGTETGLLDCSSSMTTTSCSHSSDAGVRCNPARMSLLVQLSIELLSAKCLNLSYYTGHDCIRGGGRLGEVSHTPDFIINTCAGLLELQNYYVVPTSTIF